MSRIASIGFAAAAKVAAIAAVFLLAGCAEPKMFVASTGNFAKATATLADGTTSLLASTDTAKLSTNLYEAEFAGGTVDKALIRRPFIAPNDMTARRDALALLKQYATQLSKVANANLGDDFQASTKALQTSVNGLAASINQMSGEAGNLKELESSNRAVAGLVGTIGKMIIDQQQANALAEAIIAAEEPVSKLSDLLEQDMNLVFRELRYQAIDRFSTVSEHFNDRASARRPAFSQDDRTKLMSVIRSAAADVAAQDQAKLTYQQSLQGFRSSLKAMVAFAKAKQDPKTLPDVIAATDVFLARAQALQASVEALTKATQSRS